MCGLLLLQGFKAAELAASMKLMAMQTMEADRKLLHTVCFGRDAPDALSDCQVPFENKGHYLQSEAVMCTLLCSR